MNSVVINSFFDELQNIEKDAASPLFGEIGNTLKNVFHSGSEGVKSLARAGVGPKAGGAFQAGERETLALKGLHDLAPAAAVTAAGGLGLYGAGRMAFGGRNQQ